MQKDLYLAKMRQARINALKGKYVIICDSPKDKNIRLYMQDQTLSQKGYWTAYMANAKGFSNLEDAQRVCSHLKYNHPRIAMIES